MSTTRKVGTYDKEFKLNAIKLYQSGNRSYGEVANELGIPESTLVGWIYDHKKAGAEAFVGKGHVRPADKVNA